MLTKLKADLLAAMKSGDKLRRDVIRSLQSDLKNVGIEKKGAEGLTAEVASPAEYLSDDECTAVLRSALKRRRESAEQYTSGGRAELAEAENAEAAIISEYLPQPLSEEQLKVLVQDAIQEVAAESMADMGKVMKAVQPKVGGRADGRAISQVVRTLLG